VATVDDGAIRNTPDVNILIRRQDLPAVTAALDATGFVRAEVVDVVMFLDGPGAKPSELVQLIFANEKDRPHEPLVSPEIDTVDDPAGFRMLKLDSLVWMKLLSNRCKDQVHIEDMIGVGLIDPTWVTRVPPELRDRLQQILDTPDG